MKRITLMTLCSMVLLLSVPVTGFAQEKGHIELKSIAEIELETTDDKGERVWVRSPAEKAFPGDEIIFTTTYTNISEERADNVAITNPIPEQITYRADSAEGQGAVVTFSVDGGRTFDRPENLRVTGEDGRERPARPSEYTHIRWLLQGALPPGREGTVSFRGIIK